MLKQIKNFLIMTLSITIMAIGVYYFKFPNNFTFGGVTGAAVVFAKITPLSASMFSTIVNMLLLVVGFFFLGKGFAIKTTYATILLSVELLVLEKLDPLTHPLSNEPMLELIFAIALPAIASALLFYVGAVLAYGKSVGAFNKRADVFREMLFCCCISCNSRSWLGCPD